MRIYKDTYGTYPWSPQTCRVSFSLDGSFSQIRDTDIHADSAPVVSLFYYSRQPCLQRILHENPRFFTPLSQGSILRSLSIVVTTSIDYLLMLVAMTFNAGLLTSVLLGYGLGVLSFGNVLFGTGNSVPFNANAFHLSSLNSSTSRLDSNVCIESHRDSEQHPHQHHHHYHQHHHKPHRVEAACGMSSH